MKEHRKNQKNEAVNKHISLTVVLVCLSLFIVFLFFIIYRSGYAFSYYKGQIFNPVNPTNGAFSGGIILPIVTTFLVVILTCLIACPVSLRVAFWLNLRVQNQKFYLRTKFFLRIFSGLPSVIFGLFALMVISKWIKSAFGLSSGTNLLNAILMLAIMCFPTITNAILVALENISWDLKFAGKALGLNNSQISYKIVKKAIRADIWRAYLLGFAKAIGESVALLFILKSQNYLTFYQKGFAATLTSSLKTVGALLPTNFFAENGGDELRSLMFALGLILFIIITIVNLSFNAIITSRRKIKLEFANKAILKLQTKIKNRKVINRVYHWYHLLSELVAVILVAICSLWIVGDVLINGLKYSLANSNTIVGNAGDSTLRALANTIVISLLVLIFAMPVAFFVVVYVSEYLTSTKIKNAFYSFIDAFASMPSILFGLFGYTVFISLFGFSAGGKTSHSLWAGICTIGIFILPFAIKNIQTAFASIDKDLKLSAQALGLSKAKIIYKIILPKIWPSLVNGWVLMTARIASESAPFLLTTGMNNSPSFCLTYFGQTITTRMVVQLNSTAANAVAIMYECAFISLLFFSFLFYVSTYITPKLKNFNFSWKRFILWKKT
ncbi:ABC transporter permease subunit [Mycoplasmopsis columbinasalis]|uniref:Phosphate transport system permease protein pstA n=1 Tax=Mycoplasmopsis columbinasalis TaxID=114880 RepID=A0A449BAT7_9BACT|nr:ABC transporter permease subunit [Mycoplasmopsis columbinasalis]VEU78310.1 Phosphate transport system permease protein pstA [Mycoplasmopsis columbinasalis]